MLPKDRTAFAPCSRHNAGENLHVDARFEWGGAASSSTEGHWVGSLGG